MEEAGEYAERQARMKRLSDERRAANEAESRLWAKREALGRLATKRDARQDRINRLRSTKEMAVQMVRRLQKSAKNCNLTDAPRRAWLLKIFKIEVNLNR